MFVHIVRVVIQLNNWLNFLAQTAGVELAVNPLVTRIGCDEGRELAAYAELFLSVRHALMCLLKENDDRRETGGLP